MIVPFALGTDVEIILRGSGHTLWAGATNIQEGITVDMRNITGTNLNSRRNIAKLGSGEKWGPCPLYPRREKFGGRRSPSLQSKTREYDRRRSVPRVLGGFQLFSC